MISLPMYDVHHEATVALLDDISRRLRQKGFTKQQTRMTWPADLSGHWQSGELLFSQTCGYPLVTQLSRVRTVGCFHYQARGCEEGRYRSFYLVRRQDADKTLREFAGRRLVCNSDDSQSGYNVWRRYLSADPATGGFFASLQLSGSHLQSLQALRQAAADICAIDCVSLALFARYQPERLQGLSVIGQSPLTPGLPVITREACSDRQLQTLRTVFSELVSCPEGRRLCEPLLINGFSPVERQEYQVLLTPEKTPAEADGE